MITTIVITVVIIVVITATHHIITIMLERGVQVFEGVGSRVPPLPMCLWPHRGP
jgi:hypothetical protein